MGGARFVFCGKVWLDMIAMLLAWLAALLVLLAGFSLVTVAVFSVYLINSASSPAIAKGSFVSTICL